MKFLKVFDHSIFLKFKAQSFRFLLFISLSVLIGCNADIYGPVGEASIDFSLTSDTSNIITTMDYGTRPVGGIFEQEIFVVNSGSRAIKNVVYSSPAAPFSYKGGVFPGIGGDCNSTLAVGGFCKLVLLFTPTTFNTTLDQIVMTYVEDAPGNTDGTKVLKLAGIGSTPASLMLSDIPSYDFGTIPAGGVVDHTFTLTNSGGSQAESIAAIIATANFAFTGGGYPGAGGTCSTILLGLSSCNIVVSFTPQSVGSFSDNLVVNYFDGLTGQSTGVGLTGTGVSPANLVISEAEPYDYGQQVVFSDTPHTFTITNTGGYQATPLNFTPFTADFKFTGGSYPGVGGTCTASIPGGSTCDLVVSFAPATTGIKSDNIEIDYYNGATTVNVNRGITGESMPPGRLDISETDPYDFGVVASGGNIEHTFTVTNSGGSPVSAATGTVTPAPFTFKGGSYPGTGGNCPATIAVAAVCNIVVEFAPVALGSFNGTIQLNYFDGVTTQTSTRLVQGNGTPPAQLSITATDPYDFGDRALTSNTYATFTVDNSGGVDATGINGTGLNLPFEFRSGAYPGLGGTCGLSLLAGSSCTIVVGFGPTVLGPASDSLTLNYNDGAALNSYNHGVMGNGVNPAVITISDGPTYDYLNVPTGGLARATFTLTNTGVATSSGITEVGLAAPFAFEGGVYPGTTGTCTTTLISGTTCDIVVEFSPTTTGLQQDTVEINYNDGANLQTSSRPIEGTGVAPGLLDVSEAPLYNYGQLPTGSLNSHLFVLTNIGGFPISSLVGSNLTSPFSFTGGSFPGTGGDCAATLAVAASCNVEISFDPVTISTFTNTANFDYNDGVNAQLEARDISGEGVAPASLSITETDPYDYGLQASGSVTLHTFTVTNNGSVPATAVSETTLATPFNYEGGGYPGTTGTCGSILNAGASCDLVIEFAPVSNATFNSSIQMDYNDGVNIQAATRLVTGRAANPAFLTITDSPSYVFPSVATGGNTTQLFTITNTGGVVATGLSDSGLVAPFTFLGGTYPGTGGTCNTTLASGAACDIILEFAPTTTGVQNDQLDIAYNDGAGPQTLTELVSGTGLAPALINITEADPYDYTIQPLASETLHTFTLTNVGAADATAVAGTGLAAPFLYTGGSYPGTGGTCGAIIAGGTNCEVVVSFLPTSIGVFNDTIEINYFDGAMAQTSTRDVTGEGVSPAILTIDNGPIYNFGNVANGGSKSHTFTVTNSGSWPASAIVEAGLGAPYGYLGGSYPGIGGNCGLPIAAGNNCTIVVEFAPTVLGVAVDTIEFTYFDGVSTQSVNRDVQGVGMPPALLSISELNPYDYGTHPVGSITEHTFVVTNSGGVDSTLMTGVPLPAPYDFKGAAYPGTGGTCSATLVALMNCTIVVTYNPVAIGLTNETIQINYDDGVATVSTTRDVQGTAVPPGFLTLSEADPYDYGPVVSGTSASHIFVLSNTGGFAVNTIAETGIAAPFSYRGGTYPGTSGTCNTVLAAGATCDLDIEFLPIVTGLFVDTIEVGYFDGVTAQTVNRDIQGTGLDPANLVITDLDPFDFGITTIGGVAIKTFQVTNTGSSDATAVLGLGINPPFDFEGGGGYPGASGTCGSTILASATCDVVVTFSPTVVGAVTDQMTISYNDGVVAQSLTKDLEGEGVTPALITISDGPEYDYGVVADGSAHIHTFVLTNTGQSAASLVADAGGLVAPYTFLGGAYPGTAGTCTAILNPASTCEIVIEYAPTAVNIDLDTIDISYNDNVNSQNALRDVRGTAVSPAALIISDIDPFGYGTIAVGGTAEKTFTITNTGSFAASSMADTGLTLPFSYKGGTYPGAGGTCAVILNGAATCEIVVNFDPSVLGLATDIIDISYYDGANNQNLIKNIQGTADTPALLDISDAPTYNFGLIANGTVAEHTFVVTNNGNIGATVLGDNAGLAAPYRYKGGSYPGTLGTCATALAPAATCELVIEFAPTVVGVQTDSIDLTYFNGASTVNSTRDLTGDSITPAVLEISENPNYDYGLHAVGSTTSHLFTITNTGGFTAASIADALGLAAPFEFTGGTYPGAGGDCGTTLLAAASCTISVDYKPIAPSAADGDTIEINYNDGLVAQLLTRTLTGAAAPPALITITDSPSYDFGGVVVNSNAQATFTLTNTGGVSATSLVDNALVTAPFTYEGGSYPGTSGTCTATLIAGASCDLVIDFDPLTTGVHNASIDLDYNDGATTINLAQGLQGTGLSPANITITESDPYDFGQVTVLASLTHTFTLTNIGGGTASAISGSGLAAPFDFEGGTFPGTTGTCAGTLAPAGTCEVVVIFSPTATGNFNDTFDINYNDGAIGQVSSRDVIGEGINPAVLTITEAPFYDYGIVANGGVEDHTFTITNTGGSSATALTEIGLAPPYDFAGGGYPGTGGTCVTVVAPAATCTIVVELRPTVLGAYNDTIDISYNDGATGQNLTRDVQGISGLPAQLDISEAPIYNYGAQSIGSSTPHTFVITNSGAVPATALTDLGALSLPYKYEGAGYPGTTGDCATTIAAGASCNIVINFEPSAAGAFTDTVDLSYNDGVVSQNTDRDMTGTAALPASLTMTGPDPFDYLNVTIGNANSNIFTLTNGGGVAATAITEVGLALPFQFTGGSFPGLGGNCTTSLSAGASCDVEIEYRPTATGFANDIIDFSYNNGTSLANVTGGVQGTGLAPAVLLISEGPGSYDYTTVPTGSSNRHTFTVTNTGGSTAVSIAGAGLAFPYTFEGGSYPGASGTCGASILAGANCEIVVDYNPAVVSAPTDDDDIELNYNDGAVGQLATRGVTGVAVTPASLELSEADPYNYGTLATGSSQLHTFTLTNNGTFAASAINEVGLAAPYTFEGGTFPGTGGDCIATLAGGATCNLVITYAPSVVSAPTDDDTIDISYFDGVVTQNELRTVTGTAVTPATITISETDPFDFGTIADGATATHIFTLTNTGGFNATSLLEVGLGAPFVYSGGGTFPGTAGTCTTTIGPGASCTVEIEFAPAATGFYNDVMDYSYDNGATTVSSTRQVQGTSAAPALITVIEVNPFDYGNVTEGASTVHTFTLQNAGAVDATGMGGAGLVAPFTFAGGAYPGTAGTCAAVLTPTATCEIVVQFAPTALGPFSDDIEINYNNGASGQTTTHTVDGTGITRAILTLSDTDPYDFGLIANGGSIFHTFVVTNSGATTAGAITEVSLTAPFTFRGGGYPGTGGDCGATILGSGTTCNIVVEFAPTALGTPAGLMDINYNDGVTTQSVTKALQGTSGAPAVLEISNAPTYNFGTQSIGSITEHTFTVTNTGAVDALAMVDTGGALALPYSYKGGAYPGTGGDCAATLASSAVCNLVVIYSPTGAGTFTDTISLDYNDGATGQTSLRDVTGDAAPPALLTMTGPDPFDYLNVTVGNASNNVFTLTNGGGVAATAITEVGLALPFQFVGGTFPGTAGTCTTSLSAGASCDIDIEFRPTATGFANDIIDFSYNNGTSLANVTGGVQGTGLAPAVLLISEGPGSYDYTTVPTGSINTHTFTISNTGGSPATSIAGAGLAFPYSFEGGSYPGTTGTCTVTIAAGATCDIVVNYAPSAVSAPNDVDTIEINFNDGVTGQLATRDVEGIAVTPASLELSEADPYNYGTLATGSSQLHTFTLTNNGTFAASAINEVGLAAPYTFEGGTFPGTGGDCIATLAGGATCNLVITYAPSVVSAPTDDDIIDISYFDGVVTQNELRTVTGTAVAPATITISETDPFDFGTIADGATATHIFTLTNTGGFNATSLLEVGLGAPFVYSGGGTFPGTAGTCTTTIGPGASCTVEIEFAPAATGFYNDVMDYSYDNGATTVSSTRQVQGTSAAPALITVLEVNSFDYGNVTEGASTVHTFTLQNTGAVDATGMGGAGLVAPYTFAGGAYPGTAGTCAAVLIPTATCEIVVQFSPTALGPFSDDIEINYNNGASGQTTTHTVDGTGITRAILTLSDTDPYDFGLIANGGSIFHTFVVTNSGATTAGAITEVSLAAPFTFRGGGYPGTGGDCGATILGGGTTCNIVVEFAPTSLGTPAGLMDINYNDGVTTQSVTKALQGTSGAPAVLEISNAPAYNFGTQSIGSITEHTFTVTNTGAVDALAMVDTGGALASPYNYKGGSYPGAGGDCAATLASSAVCNIVVEFTPTGSGTFPDTISLDYNDGATGQTSVRDITGNAAPPAVLTITEADPYNFGLVTIGSTSTHVFTITNTGGVAANSIAEIGLAAPYGFTGGSFPGALGTCGVSLSVGSSCDIQVEFAPIASGVQLDTIEISYDNGTSTVVLPRDVTATGIAAAVLTISDGPGSYDFTTVPTGSVNTHTFTVTNSGASTATVMVGGGLVAPYSYEGGTYPGATGDCAGSLAAGANCEIVVVYNPTALSAPNDLDTIDISYYDGATTTSATRDVEGIAVAPADLDISETDPYNFGTFAIGATQNHTFTITNNGGFQASSMAETGITLPDYIFFGGSYPGTGGNCASNLAASASCTIVLQYGPTTAAVHNDTITMSYNDGVDPKTESRLITGTGVTPANLTITEAPFYDYGTIAVGSTSSNVFVVANTGGHIATSLNEIGLAAPFQFVGGTFPGVGGTCTTSLNPSTNCTLFIEFAPTVTGLANDEIQLSYDNGAVTDILTRQVQGNGSSVATITISEAPDYTFPDTTLGTTRLHTFNLTNTGGVPATSLAGGGLLAPFTFEGGSFPGTTGSCTATLGVGSTCTAVVEYAPTVAGLGSDSIDITYNNGAVGASNNRVISGTALNPAILTLSESPLYDYGVVANGGSVSHTFVLTNSGGSSATGILESGIAAPFDYLGGGYPGTGGNCTGILIAGASCNLVIEFAPTALGTPSDIIDIAYNDGTDPQTTARNIQGTAGAPALLTIDNGPTFDFGSQATGSVTDQTFTINNSGAVSATAMADAASLGGPFSYNGGTYPGVGGSCAGTLATGASCTIVVRYQPTAPGLITDTIDINYDNGVLLTNTTRDIEGTGATPANITISETEPYDYGVFPVGSVAEHTFTLNNSGQITATAMAEITLAPPFNFKGATYPGTGGSCTTTLSGGGTTCTVVVEFTPTATGIQSSTITVSYDNGAAIVNATRGVQATGVGVAVLGISEINPFSYGIVPTGSSNLHTFVVTNSGGFQASSVSGLGISAPYSYFGGSFPGTGGDCLTTLNAGSTCNVVVEYAPTAVSASDPDTMQVDYFDGVGTQSTTRDVVGIAVAPATLTISETEPYSYGTLATGATAFNTFTITNTGSFTATAISETGVAAPFRYLGGGFPGTGGNCTTTINAGSSCDIVVEYAPTIPALDSVDIDISYNDGVAVQSVQRGIEGIAVTPALLQISEADPFSMGTVSVGSKSTHIFTITNTGGHDASVVAEVGMATPFKYVGGSYPGTAGNCGTDIVSLANCTIEVEFEPGATGLFQSTITFSYNNGASPQVANRDIEGIGATPAVITITETDPYDYGSVTQGSSASQIFTLTNTGGVTATSMAGTGLVAPYTFLGASYPGTGGSCGGSLAPAATCTIVVNFAPTGLGPFGDSIDIAFNDGTTTQTSSRTVTGTGIAPATLEIDRGPTYDYNLIAAGGIKTEVFTVTNTGASIATSIVESGLASPFEFFGGSYPGTGGSCSASLAPTVSCTMVIAYRPTVPGVDANTINLDYFDGAATQATTRAVQGTAGAPASVAITTNPFDYGTVAVGGTVANTFTLTNSGGVPAAALADSGLLNLPFEFKGGTFPGVGGTCLTDIPSSSSCTVVVDFKPTAVGPSTDQIEVNYNNGIIITSTVGDVEGVGALPANLGISESDPYNYGTLAVGSTDSHLFTITNSGGVSATSINEVGLLAPFTFLGGSFPGTGGTCTASLNAGASCQIAVEFAPTATGAQSRTITVTYFDGSATQNATRDIIGTGAAPATLTISESDPYNYGTVTNGATESHTFIITNTGGVPASSISGSGLVAPFNWTGGTFPGTAGDCTATLAAAATCIVDVEFAPLTAGAQTGTFTINYNDGVAGQTSDRDVSGTGITPAMLTISDGAIYDFGSVVVGNQVDKIFTVTNSGTTDATAIIETGLAAPYSFPGGSYPGAGGTCGAIISNATPCTIVVRFQPTSAAVGINDTIELSYFDGAASQVANRDITGTGATPASINISDGPTYDFGTVPVGGTGEWTFTLDNVGGFGASAITEVGLAPPFNFKGGSYPGGVGTCGLTLASGSNCTIVVEFSPTATGTQPDVLDFSYFNGTTTVNSQRNIQGSAGSPAQLLISDAPTYDFGKLAVGTSATKVLTVTNTGGIGATSITGAGLASPYGFTGGLFPGTLGNCTSTLAPSTSCTVEIVYNPTTANVDVDTLDIFYNDGLTGVLSQRNITGEAVNPALLVISDGPTFDYGLLLTGFNTTKVFNITNTGGADASLISASSVPAPYSYTGGAYPGTAGTCGTDLVIGDSCTIEVSYAPFATGADAATISINYNNSASTVATTRDVTGRGYLPLQSLTLNNPSFTPANDQTPEILISDVVEDLGVRLYADATCTGSIMNAGSVPTAATTLPLTSAALIPDGTYEFHAIVQDDYGNLSGCSGSSVTYTVDSVAPTPSSWPWTFDGITDGGHSPDNTPKIDVTGVVGEEGTTVQIYDNSSCSGASAKGSPKNIASGLASFFDISYLADGTEDGLKEFYAIATDAVGNISSCQTITLDYTLDTQILQPDITAGIICGATVGPAPTLSVTCEPNATVNTTLGGTATATLTPDPTSVTCPGGGLVSIPLVMTDGSAPIQITQTDLAGNLSTIESCLVTVQTAATIASTTPAAADIVFDNKAAFPLTGSCSHEGTNNISISGSFVGSPHILSCSALGAWSTTLDFSPLSDNTVALESIVLDHNPGDGATPGAGTADHYNCRRVSEMQYMNDSRLLFTYQYVGGANQIPIWDLGDGSPEQQAGAIDYTYSSGSAPYNVKIKHCPREIRDIYYLRTSTTRNVIEAQYTNFFPGGFNEYINLTRFYINNGSQNNFGFIGDMPDVTADHLVLNSYDVHHMPQTNDFPDNIYCNSLTWFYSYGRSNLTPATYTMPNLDPTCYSTLRDYRMYYQHATGDMPDLDLFGPQLRNYIIYDQAADLTFPDDLSHITSLRILNLYNNGNNGGTIATTAGTMPVIKNNTSMTEFQVGNNSISSTIDANYLTGGSLAGLQIFDIYSNTLTGNAPFPAAQAALRRYRAQNNLLSAATFPDPSGLGALQYFQVHGNLMVSGPYPWPDWSALFAMRYWDTTSINFTGSTFGLDEMHGAIIQLYSNNSFLDIDNYDVSGSAAVQRVYINSSNFIGSSATSIFNSGGTTMGGFRYFNFRNHNLTTAELDALIDDLHANKDDYTVTTTKTLLLDQTNGTISPLQVDKIEGTGAYVGDGLVDDNWDVRYN